MSNQTLETNVTISGFSRIDFDRRKVRKSMRTLGRDVQKEARRLVARRAISGAGEYPGRQTGALWRAIKAKVSRSGFMVVVRPQKTAEMDFYYPAVLNSGSEKMNIKARKNYMTDALDRRRENSRRVLRATLQDALIPRK
ncbi:MAG: hypothetical protein COX55_03510 [Zetaproteobacteria bacterium CG23_combo_of_CG06-09_8_20_14_all_54_7]|nr:MAG: hypothetical protein COX55_03510 [Zetaproteobacteria bacterium CG23_combo_of_CG06-09_8_20_14_all_54_7]